MDVAPDGKFFSWVKAISAAMTPPLLLGMLAWGVSIEKFRSATGANRHTASDQAKHEQQVARQFTDLWLELSKIQTTIAKLPPDKHVEYVESIDERLRRIEIEQARFHRGTQ